jgi:autotransporter-associated beta strand protein
MKRSLLSATTLSLRVKPFRASNLRCAAAVSALAMIGSTSPLLSETLYWDVNGSTAGFSTVVGAWNDTSTFWNTDSVGGAGTLSAVTTSADDLFIQQATTNTGSITLSGATKNASSITFSANVGPTTNITSGTVNIGGSGAFSGIRQQSTGANTINSALQLNSGNTAFDFSNSSIGLLTIGGAVTGTATSGNVTQTLSIGSSSSGGITFGGIIADVSGSATRVALTVNNTSTGVTTLSGANTYTGGTTISAGTLSVGSGSSTGSIAGDVANSGILTFNRSNALTYGGIVSGTGAVTKSGAGTLTLTGANSYDGTTTISAGSLNLQHATGLGSTVGGTSVASSAALQLEGGITVGAEALTLNGSGVSNTGALLNVSGDNTYGGAITRGTTTTIGSTAGTLTLSGTLGGNFSTTFTGAGNITSSGVISSTAGNGITKSGTGTLTLSAANTLTGSTTVSGGKVVLTNALALQLSAYNTTGSNGTTIGMDVSGALTSGNLTLGGLAGAVDLAGAFTAGFGSVTDLTLNLPRNQTYSGVIADGASAMTLTKTGASGQTLSGANTYTGDTYVNQGSLLITHNDALGTTAGKTVVNAAVGALSLSNNITVAEPITVIGPMTSSGSLTSASGTNTLSGPVTITNSSARVRVDTGSLTFTGGVTATEDVTLVINPAANSTLALTTTALNLGISSFVNHDSAGLSVLGVAGNTFGRAIVSNGTMRLDVANALPSTAEVRLGASYNTGGTLDLNGNSQTIFGLWSNPTLGGPASSLVVTSAAPATLTLDSSAAGTILGADPLNTSTTAYAYAGTITGALNIAKNGPNTVTFSGANTYTGATTVTAGQLTVNGSSSSSAHTVGNGATLGGSGTVGALVVQSGGTIAPGNSPGILSVSGDTTWLNGGNYNWQLLDSTGAAGTGWDQLAITGALDLTGLTSGGFNVNVSSLSTFAGTTGNALNFDASLSYSWLIATASAGITGFDAGDFTIYTGPNNGTNGFTNSFTGTFSMSQTGNNLNLIYTQVPEPASAFTMLALFSGAVLLRRKRAVK